MCYLVTFCLISRCVKVSDFEQTNSTKKKYLFFFKDQFARFCSLLSHLFELNFSFQNLEHSVNVKLCLFRFVWWFRCFHQFDLIFKPIFIVLVCKLFHSRIFWNIQHIPTTKRTIPSIGFLNLTNWIEFRNQIEPHVLEQPVGWSGV